MIILGVDPGTASMGFGIVSHLGNRFEVMDFGVISTSPRDRLPARLRRLHDQLISICERYRPEAVAVEQLFFGANSRTALAVGQARGVALLAVSHWVDMVGEYTPLQVKQAVVGYGRASKSQVQAMVKNILGMAETPSPDDAADALAVAICHAHSARLLGKLEGLG